MLSTQKIRVAVRCQDPLVSAGLQATLQAQPDFELLAGTADTRAADLWVADYGHALALIDESRRRSLQRNARIPKVLVVTQRDSEREILHALESGVRGYLILGCGLEELVGAARTVHQGLRHVGALAAQRLADSAASAPLTCRETDVLHLVAHGNSNKAIARQLDIAMGTVKSHLKVIFEKLGAASRTEAAAIAERRGLLALAAQPGKAFPTSGALRQETLTAAH